MRDWSKRLCSTVLAATLLVSNIQPVFAFAEEAEDTGLCEHHVTHENCGYVAAVAGADCKHEHDNGCFTVKCTHVHGDCGYVAAVEGVDCDHQHDGDCGYAEAVAEVPCTCQQEEHTEDCAYAPAIPEVKCNHVHGECSFVEAKSEIPCGHDCTQDEACGEKVLNCVHRHDESCGYVAAVEGKACDFVCEVCAAEEASAAAVAEVKALMEALPELEAVRAMSMEEQKAAYEQTQAAYEAYGKLTADQQQELADPEEVFKPLFEYFNTLIDADGELGSGTPDGTAPVLNGLTISATAVTAPGKIEVVVDAYDSISGVAGGHIVFECLETEHTLNCSLFNSYYDESTGTDTPYTDGKLHGSIIIDQYNLSGTYKIRAIGLEDKAGNRINMYSRTYNDGVFEPYIPEQYESLQFKVEESTTPDDTAPTLNNLTISTTNVTAPGNIEVIVEASDLVSGVAGGHVVFECLETEHTLNCSLSNYYYDEETCTDIPYADGKLHGTITIDQYNLSGIYKIRAIGLEDKAGNRVNMYSRTYNDGFFEPYIPEQYESLQFTVQESATPDNSAPTLNSLTISATNVTAPGNIEVIVEASDLVSGVDGGHVVFECSDTRRELNCSLFDTYYDEEASTDVPYTDGKLHGTIIIDQYNLSGTYKIRAIGLVDNAGNSVNMFSRTYNNGFFEPYIPEQYESLQFTVTNADADITTSTNQATFVEDVKNAANDAYIVADFSSNSTLPQGAFDGIAGTNKTLDLTSEGVTWRFEGNDITEDTKSIDLSVQITKAESNTSDAGQAIQDKLNDTPGYIMKFAENGELPGKATIQIKVDYAMREHLGSSTGLNVYYYNNQSGELELVAENLSVINDTYVEFSITHCSYYVLTAADEDTVNEIVTGTCGANLTWKYSNITNVLTISGTGPMTDFNVSENAGYVTWPTDTPWVTFKDDVREIVIEDGVTTIGKGAFACFNGLILISLPDTLASIGDHAFNGDVALKRLDIPNSVTYLGDYSVCCCATLASVTLPSGITKIGKSVFDQSWPINITVPANVTEIASKAFANGTIGEIVFTGNAPIFAEDAFHNQTTTIWYPSDNVTWTDSVRQNYGGTITWIAVDASLENPELGAPTYTTAAGTWANNIFWNLDADGLLTISGTGVMEHFAYEDRYIDFSSGVLYPWQAYASGITKLVVEDGITELNDNAFSKLPYLKSVILPDSLTDMQDNTFTNCVSLQEVNLGSGVTRIGQGSFDNCLALTSIVIPGNVKLIDYYAFDGCTNLKNTILSEGVTTIWKMAFRGCTALTSIGLPDSVTTLKASAFEGCTGLTEVTVPKNVAVLEKHVFYNCSNLKELYFAGDVPQFDSYALLNLVATAYYPNDNTTWTDSVRKDYGGEITWKAYCANGHTVVTDKAVEATCTATGSTEGKHCSACGEVLTAQTTVAAKGHNYVNGYCSRCGIAAPTFGGSTGDNGSTNNGSAGNGGSTNTGNGNAGTTTRPTTQPNQNGAELSAKELGASADRNASTTIAVDGIRVTFDAKAQKAIADQATKDDIYLHYEEIKEAKLNKDQKKAIKDHLSDHKGQKHVLTFSITLISGGKEIHDFKGGTATVKIPFTPNPGTKGDDYKVFFVDGNGELYPMETSYKNGYLVVKLTHFSEYVVFYMPEEVTEEIAETTVAADETVAEDEPATITNEPVQVVKATKTDSVGMILWIIIALCIVGIVVIGVILLRMRKNKN